MNEGGESGAAAVAAAAEQPVATPTAPEGAAASTEQQQPTVESFVQQGRQAAQAEHDQHIAESFLQSGLITAEEAPELLQYGQEAGGLDSLLEGFHQDAQNEVASFQQALSELADESDPEQRAQLEASLQAAQGQKDQLEAGLKKFYFEQVFEGQETDEFRDQMMEQLSFDELQSLYQNRKEADLNKTQFYIEQFTGPEFTQSMQSALEGLTPEQLQDPAAIEQALIDAEVQQKGSTPEEAKSRWEKIKNGLLQINTVIKTATAESLRKGWEGTSFEGVIDFLFYGSEGWAGGSLGQELMHIPEGMEEMKAENLAEMITNDPKKTAGVLKNIYLYGNSQQEPGTPKTPLKEKMRAEIPTELFDQAGGDPPDLNALQSILKSMVEAYTDRTADSGGSELWLHFRSSFPQEYHQNNKHILGKAAADKLESMVKAGSAQWNKFFDQARAAQAQPQGQGQPSARAA